MAMQQEKQGKTGKTRVKAFTACCTDPGRGQGLTQVTPAPGTRTCTGLSSPHRAAPRPILPPRPRPLRGPARRGKEFPADPPPAASCAARRAASQAVPDGARGPAAPPHHAVAPPPPPSSGRPRRRGLAARASAPAAGGAGQAGRGPAAAGGQAEARRGDRLR